MERLLGSRYVLGEPLGSGALGEVFAAIGPDGRECAVKLLHADLTRAPAAVAKFLRAQAALVGLTQPNLVTLHDLVVSGETVVLVLDPVPGGSLRERAPGPLPPAEVARIAAGVAAALAAVHDAGVAHGDVKPENVLVDDSDGVWTPKLADAGVSRLAPPRTSKYTAPELGDAGQATPAADLYALGTVMYELYCGVTPFPGGFVRGPDDDPGRPSEIPGPLWDVVRLLLAMDPAARPAAEQIATVLTEMQPGLAELPAGLRLHRPPPITVAARKNNEPGSRRHGKTKKTGLQAAVVVVAGAAIVALTTPSTAGTPVATPPSPARYLDEVQPVGENPLDQNRIGAVAGKTYPHTIAERVHPCAASSSVDYDLSRGYRRLVASAGVDDSAGPAAGIRIEIFGDGHELGSAALEPGKVTPIDVDVTGVGQLRIERPPGSGCGFDLGEARLLG